VYRILLLPTAQKDLDNFRGKIFDMFHRDEDIISETALPCLGLGCPS
jgi:hypothetical protein